MDKQIEPVFLRTEHNYDMLHASDQSAIRAGLNFPQNDPDAVSKTQQSFKDECDINVIVDRFGITGEMPQVLQLPQYGDFTGIFDFQSAMNAIRQAQETFDSMTAEVRARFDNNPQKFLEYCESDAIRDPNSSRHKEAIELGILKPAVPESTGEPPVAPSEPKTTLPPAGEATPKAP